MAEEKKIKVIFKEGLSNITNPLESFKENQTAEISEEYFKHLVKSGIKVEQVNAK
jgi:hypothetical protein